MSSAVCTLFEGQYHFGLAALTNSLYKEGFRGSIYAGYRGTLPPWAISAKDNLTFNWKGAKTLPVAEGIQLHFLPLDTKYHLTNYKPDFMITLWNGIAKDAERMFYFDPDIVIVRSWLLFEEWVTCGIALCEDVNSPLSKQHPRRVAWRRYFGGNGIDLNFKNIIYVNGGFIGLGLANRDFLNVWKKLQEEMAPLIGGLDRSIFEDDHLTSLEQVGGPFMPFVKTDQDALNAAIEYYDPEVSFIGKEGMGFENGFILMHHALGNPKPWDRKSISQSLSGRPPRKVDIAYLDCLNTPIKVITKGRLLWLRVAMTMSMAVGRFYKRN